MINQNTFTNLNIPGKNILKDETKRNLNDIFSTSNSSPEVDNYIINSNLDNGNIIR